MISGTLGFVAIGELLGAGIVIALGRLGSDLLYGVSPRDPMILGLVAAFLFVISLGAALWPAWSSAGRGYNL